jgi:hypothetical protein
MAALLCERDVGTPRGDWLDAASLAWCLSLPREMWCLSLPHEAWCPSLPREMWCLSLPREMWCLSLPREMWCLSLPREMWCLSLPRDPESERALQRAVIHVGDSPWGIVTARRLPTTSTRFPLPPLGLGVYSTRPAVGAAQFGPHSKVCRNTTQGSSTTSDKKFYRRG